MMGENEGLYSESSATTSVAGKILDHVLALIKRVHAPPCWHCQHDNDNDNMSFVSLPPWTFV